MPTKLQYLFPTKVSGGNTMERGNLEDQDTDDDNDNDDNNNNNNNNNNSVNHKKFIFFDSYSIELAFSMT
jgi:hypothetical protein